MRVSIKRAAIAGLCAVGAAALLVAMLIGWLGWKARVARRGAETLCAAFPEGAVAETFDQRARELNLRSMPDVPLEDDPRGDIVVHSAYGSALMARWFCSVEAASGKVVTAKVSFLD
jgi:hypothetical protein